MRLSLMFIVLTAFVRERTFKMYLVTKTAQFARMFFILCFCGLLMYVALAFYTFHLAFSTVSRSNMVQYKMKRYPAPEVAIDLDTIQLKYILLWTTPEFKHNLTADGDAMFINNDCAHLNCYLTTNKTLLSDLTQFDSIIFSISTLHHWKKNVLKIRSHRQKFVFYATLSANEYPLCYMQADGFFNWTWTYKLNSDIPTPFIEVKDVNGHLVAPDSAVEWPDLSNDTYVNTTQPNKRKAIMWHNENCDNERSETFVKGLKSHLPYHGLEIDMYGCDKEKCPPEGCDSIIDRYFYYLAFEASISDDYVTKKVVKGYSHDTVPVVVGGADYGKFLPPGSFIDARYDSPERLASLLGYIAKNPPTYHKYYSWKKHYTISEANLEKGYCRLCDLLNDKVRTEVHSSYEHLRKWWYYGNLRDRCYPKGAETYDELLSYIGNPKERKNYMP